VSCQIEIPYFIREGGQHTQCYNTIEERKLQGVFREITPPDDLGKRFP
jgi:hypothetical protein